MSNNLKAPLVDKDDNMQFSL